MKKFSFARLFENSKFVYIFSLMLAAFSWIFVAMTTSQTIEITVRDVPVDMSLQLDTLQEMGLSLLEGGDQQVSVTVRGQRTVVGQLTPDDLSVTVRISSITDEGTYDLQLISAASTVDFEIVRFTPNTIRVRLDRLVTRTFDIEPQVKGISTPPDYMWDTERVQPETVSVTGPETELEKIDKCVVSVELEEPLTNYYTDDVPITLLDAEGNEIDPEDRFLTLDVEEAYLVIPVYRVKELPLEVGFTKVPMGFPVDDLTEFMMMSNSSVSVAGPVSVMDNYQKIRLGYIDISELTPENNRFDFEVPLPSDSFTNLNNITTVTVEFDVEYWDTAVFNISEITMFNEPGNYEITLLSQGIPGVMFVGDEFVIEEMSLDDIVAEIDFSERELTPGQYSYPVKISVPTKGLVWAVGEHTVTIQVTEVEEE